MKAIESNTQQFISSRVIANVAGKSHHNVMADIREMCIQAEVKITSTEKSVDVHNQEVIVIEHISYVNIAHGAKRPVKEYLLNDMAAEVLALGYDVKRRIAVLKLVKEMKAALETRNDNIIPIPEVARMYNMGINVFRGKLRYYGILGNVKTDYKQYNKPYLKFIADGCFIGDQPTKIKGLSLINEVFRTGESLREANDINSKENESKVDCLYAIMRAVGGLLYTNMEGSNLSPKRQAAINTLQVAMHNADELFNQNKQKSLG
jgi:phage regulator Rha-like protein